MTNAAPADRAATESTSRRALLGAGVIGAALAVTGSRSVSAAAPESNDDARIADLAIAYELAARDLYDDAIEAGSTDELWHILREQHESYAQRVSGLVGKPANTASATLYEALSTNFASAEPIAAAVELENTLAATHTEWLATVTDRNIAIALASVVSLESRHAAILGLRANVADGDQLFTNSAAALTGEA
ncbi:MAG TPA: hypothetical protein VMM60_01625 [Ilumatobacter sp.]|nr:hypothetical protein [Ilumatobacter sp.]